MKKKERRIKNILSLVACFILIYCATHEPYVSKIGNFFSNLFISSVKTACNI